MSKYQEALNNVRKFEREHNMSKFGDVVPQPNSDTLQELVDKETPIKPINTVFLDTHKNVKVGNCPNCKDDNLHFWHQKYCWNCGQKLDWSDTDE